MTVAAANHTARSSGSSKAGEIHARPRRLPAWLLSTSLHAILMLLLGLALDPSSRQAGVEPDRTAGIALVQRSEQRTTYYSEESQSDSSSSSAESAPAEAQAALPSARETPVEAEFSLPTASQSNGADRSADSGVPSAEGFTVGSQPRSQVSGEGAQTQVFGAEGSGSEFVYVFDQSGSMQGSQGRPMAAAKSELIASLKDLSSVHQFQIVFYNHETFVFNPLRPQPPRLMFGTDENKQLAIQYIRGITPAGATRHLEALELALGMNPDVIFFLTDADEPQLTPRQLDKLRRRNGGVTSINTIEFGWGPFPGGDNFLVRLARQNRGRHVYVDISRLSSRVE